jgi:hypothetical protein
MERKLGCLSMTGFVLLFASAAIRVDASIRPSFSLDRCSWFATHIVLVQTTSEDGVFSVVESWKGDLNPGDLLDLPELRPKNDAVGISNSQKPEGFGSEDAEGISEQIPRQAIGSRMILFLKKQAAETSPGAPQKWAPALGAMKISTIWIDAGKAYCFQQWMNPGPSALSLCMWSPARSSDVAIFTARIQQVLQVQQDLKLADLLENAEARAQRLGYIALGDVYPAQREAMDALGKSGNVALPAILQVMDKPPGFYDGDALIRMVVEASGKDSGRFLHARLRQDAIYWETVGPTLTEDWLGELIVVGSPLFVKFNETSLLIRELDKEHYAPAAQTVAELRSFWISQPQLYDPKWGERDLRDGGTGLEMMRAESFALAKQCDDFVKHSQPEI